MSTTTTSTKTTVAAAIAKHLAPLTASLKKTRPTNAHAFNVMIANVKKGNRRQVRRQLRRLPTALRRCVPASVAEWSGFAK